MVRAAEGIDAVEGDGGFARQFDAAFAQLQVQVEDACGSEREWTAQVAAAVRTALDFAAAHPDETSVLTTEAMIGGEEGFDRFNRMIDHFAAGLAPGRARRPEGRWLPEITEKTMVGGLASMVAQRLHVGDHARLPGTAPEAIEFVLTPFVGLEEAKAAARRCDA